MTTSARLFWEILPIILAMLAIVVCSRAALTSRRSSERIGAVAAVVCAVLMIVAQVSWSWTVFIKGDIQGTDVANFVWTMFNTGVMATFLYTYGPRR